MSLATVLVQAALVMAGASGTTKLTLTALAALVEMAPTAAAESSRLAVTCSVSLVPFAVAACKVDKGTVTATVPAAMSAAVSVTT